ncbi:MAG: hypothetical protein K6L80_04515 [Agarilytica sp.]
MLITLDLIDHDRCHTGLDLALTVVAFEQALDIVFVDSSIPAKHLDHTLSPAYQDKLAMLTDMGLKRICVYGINTNEIAPQHDVIQLSKDDFRSIVQQHVSSVSF